MAKNSNNQIIFQLGLDCEGAGMCNIPDDCHGDYKVFSEVAKKSKGEAMLDAWSKVVLVIVNCNKVSVEINTTKQDKFFYDPTWDEPVIEVNEVELEQSDN